MKVYRVIVDTTPTMYAYKTKDNAWGAGRRLFSKLKKGYLHNHSSFNKEVKNGLIYLDAITVK